MILPARLGALSLALLLAAPSSFAAKAKRVKDIAKGSGVTISLKDDREVKGVYLGRHDGAVWVGVDGGEIGIEPDSIVKITPTKTGEAEFLKRKAALPPNDAAAWWKLAVWARDKDMAASARSAAETVIELQPDHAEARALLGHEKINGRWLDYEEAKRAHGFVQFEGEWISEGELSAIKQGRDEDRRGRAQARPPSIRAEPESSTTIGGGYTEKYRRILH